MVGDFNSRPGRPTYDALLAAGFDDAWTRANPGRTWPGSTCCHAHPLDDPGDALRGRIDHVLTRGDDRRHGGRGRRRRPRDFRAGLWPSDHAGVVATSGRSDLYPRWAMRIALVSPYSWSHPGGVTRHIEALAAELPPQGMSHA